jgi:hypothetical protein
MSARPERGVAALARRERRTPLTTAPVYAAAIMVATFRLELGFSQASYDMWSALAKPAIKIWSAAYFDQGLSWAAHGAHGREIDFLLRRLFSIDLKRF